MENYNVVSKYEPTYPQRFLIYSEEKGIYLGKGMWSYDRIFAKAVDRAPSFIAACGIHAKELEGIEYTLHSCFPDLPDFNCSQNAISNAMLPRWK